MQTQNLIEEQIDSCRELLKIFKTERETYGDSSSIDISQVVSMVKRKQEILGTFSKQKEIMQAIKEHGHQNEELEKKLLRELGRILEQLLVIDQENEILLRDLLRKKPGTPAKNKITSKISQTPDLPFCPGQKKAHTQAKVNTPGTIDKKAVAPKSENQNLFSRNKLKAYGA